MKRIFTFLLALMMALVLAVPTFAEETTYSITITNAATGHTYEAYQIFAGDLHESLVQYCLGQRRERSRSDGTG